MMQKQVDNNKKNIILISNESGALVDSLLETNKFNIKLYVLPYKKDIKHLKEKYNDKIEEYFTYIKDTNEEFQNDLFCDYDMTYDEIESFRSTQLKCYRYNCRYITDDNTNNSIYYTALKYFLNYFNENSIDCVISYIVEHGSISDSLIFDIAKSKNIPVYILSSNSGFGSINLLSVLYYNNKKFIDLSNVTKKKVNVDFLLNELNRNYSNNKFINFPFSKLITKFIYKKNKNFFDCLMWFYNWRIKIYLKYFKHSMIDDLYKICEETSFFQMLKGHFYFKKIKKFYNKHSVSPIGCDNYILYPLHLEPEAAIMSRVTMNCQLFLIEQISRCLPNGWFLYIKEHPDQFNSVSEVKYMNKSIFNFRNIDFYKRITKLKNVKLIKINVSSSDLIEESKCVLSISGSVLIEAIARKKPVIIFGNGTKFIENLVDAFKIRSIGDISKAINNILNGFVPNYYDFYDIANKFSFNFDNKNFYTVNDELVSIFLLINNFPTE